MKWRELKNIVIKPRVDPIGALPVDAELQRCFREMIDAGEDKERQQILYETYAHCFLRDRCGQLLELLHDAHREDLVLTQAYEFLLKTFGLLRQHGLDLFGPVPTANTCAYPAGGPGVSMAEQLAGAPDVGIFEDIDRAVAPSRPQGSMLPLEEQINAAMMDLLQYWELGHMKNQIRPGLGDIGPFLKKRAYLVLTGRVIDAFETIARERSDSPAEELAKLLRDCRRQGIEAALRDNPQPSGPRAT